jgi:hypothetical protein
MVDTPMKYIEEEVVEEAVPVPVPVQSLTQETSS